MAETGGMDLASTGLTVYFCHRHRPKWRWLIPGRCPLCGGELEPVAYVPARWLEPEEGDERPDPAPDALRRDLARVHREWLGANSRAAIAESEREIAEAVIEDLGAQIDELEEELDDCRLTVVIAERLAELPTHVVNS